MISISQIEPGNKSAVIITVYSYDMKKRKRGTNYGISSSKVKKKFLAGKKKINSGENQIIAVNHHTFEM